jgi:glycosyltransferase involved in cell wall biosynthesis
MRPLRVAMVGQRGVPATFGGVERHVEELGARLADRGHEITVYCRTNYVEDRRSEYRGMRLRTLSTVGTKHLDAIVHSGLSTIDAMRSGVDVVHYHAIGPGFPSFLPRYAARARVVQTVHGLDAERAKWSPGAKAILRSGEWLSARVPDATIVVAENLADHYEREYGRSVCVIPNGVNPGVRRPPTTITDRWGLTPGSYALFVGRLVPEKAPDLLVRAWSQVPGDQRLVVVGGSSFTDDYVRALEGAAQSDPRIVLAGYVYGSQLQELYANATAFILPSILEGLPLTLLEAASYGTPIVASDIPPHLEVLGADGPGHRLFPAGSEARLVEALARMRRDPGGEAAGAEELRDRVLATYRWDDVAERTEAVYLRALAGRGSRR